MGPGQTQRQHEVEWLCLCYVVVVGRSRRRSRRHLIDHQHRHAKGVAAVFETNGRVKKFCAPFSVVVLCGIVAFVVGCILLFLQTKEARDGIHDDEACCEDIQPSIVPDGNLPRMPKVIN